MSAPQPGTREVALGLVEALRPALAAGAPSIAIVAARDVAHVMGLEGLAAALAELERHTHAGGPWPADVDHVAARIARMAGTAASDGDLLAFHHADRELGMLAAQLAATEWSTAGAAAGPGVATIAADEALAGLVLEATDDARRVRLTMTVASAVRAALDWLGADESARVTLDVHDSALTLGVSATHAGGIGPAGAVLAAVEGSLGREAEGRWTIRVSTSTERASYLLLRQGRYGLALPWHSVARLRMFAPHELERLVEPRLAPLSTGVPSAGEQPAALVALGLARAWFVADRIVWRIAARAEEADVAGPFAGSSRVVEVESGERYWVLEPGWLLRGIAPPDAPPPSPRPRASTTTLEALPKPSAPVAVTPASGAAVESLADAVERALAQLRLERTVAEPASDDAPPDTAPVPGDARYAAPDSPEAYPPGDDPAGAWPGPFAEAAPEARAAQAPAASAAPVADVDPPARFAGEAAGAQPGPRSAPSPSDLAARLPSRRALIADDSLVARIFLGRLLEKRGWIVETVADAASLWDELHRGPWALVCADIALPDAQGAKHVSQLLDFLGRGSAPPMCIVLTRDAADERVARGAGATLVLRKPFESACLDTLLPR